MKSKYIILILVTFTLLFGCQFREPTALPGELLGVWKTSAPKYEGCFFEITKDSITFANRDSLKGLDVNVISKIEKTHKEKQILYAIHYTRKGKVKNTNSPFTMIRQRAVQYDLKIIKKSSGGRQMCRVLKNSL